MRGTPSRALFPATRVGGRVVSTATFSFVVSAFISCLFTWLIRHVAVARGWATGPTKRHHLHVRPVPRLGGVAIFGSFIAACAATLLVARPWAQQSLVQTLSALLPSATIIFMLGLADDVFGVGPYRKLLVQAVAATMLFHAGFRIIYIPLLFNSHQLGTTVGLCATVLWVLWIMNAFNLIDGIDGLAAGSALFSTVAVFIVSLLNGRPVPLLLTAVLSGALLGFLRFNFNPATIFLGDSGSLFIGFMLAALSLGGQKAPTVIAVSIPVVAFGLPILETVISVLQGVSDAEPEAAELREVRTLRRTRLRRPAQNGRRSHRDRGDR